MKKPELLAPVGGKPHLIAAVNSGADAVYMGGMAFNARIFADNFSDEELPDAINYAHAHDVKVYMTINTLVTDRELARAFEYCNYIYGLGVDGIIVQDMGLARLVRKYLPELPMHLSTQATLYNARAVKTARKLGFCRVVPARELSLEEIRELVSAGAACGESAGSHGGEPLDSRPVDVEVFVHGALCMCYSGQCQMSRSLGGGSGRTGNRGTCAQPCRHAYTAESGDTCYALSPKDLCLINRIPQLMMSGAASFKIEGRMKSPEYVAVVTGIYRKYIDLFYDLCKRYGKEKAAEMYRVDEADMLDLKQIFNRGDFTEGYLFGDPGEDLLSGASPKNQGLRLGRVAAVIDSEAKVSERDEKSAARGALRRGKELVCIELGRSALHAGITVKNGDGLEFRNEESDYLVSSPAGGVATFIKDIGHGQILAGDFDRGVMMGDTAFRVTDSQLMKRALDAPEKKIPVTISFTAREGQFPVLVMTDVKAGNSIEISADHRTERARKAATDADQIERNLARLGDTPYSPGLTGIDVQIDDDIMMPLSIVNRMRREAAEKLLADRLSAVMSGRSPKLSREQTDRIREEEMLGVRALDLDEWSSRIRSSSVRPVPLEDYMAAIASGEALPEGTVPYILNVSKGRLDEYIEKNFDRIVSACRDCGILAGNPGWIESFTAAGVKVLGDYGLNIYNEQARLAYEELGVDIYMLSHETGISDERGIPLMITEHALDTPCLTDRKGEVHRIVTSPSGDKTLIY